MGYSSLLWSLVGLLIVRKVLLALVLSSLGHAGVDILASSVIDLTADLGLQTDKCPKEAGSHLALG